MTDEVGHCLEHTTSATRAGRALYKLRLKAARIKLAEKHGFPNKDASIYFVACTDAAYKIGLWHAAHPKEASVTKVMTMLLACWTCAAEKALRRSGVSVLKRAYDAVSCNN